MSDLVRGKYPLGYAFRKATGAQSNATQANLGIRSNLEWLGVNALTDQAAALVSGVATVVPVPVQVGDIITKVSVATGATAESGGSHAWAALYSGVLTTAVLQGAQSVDVTGATAIAASARFDFTIPALEVTPQMVPYGYLYVAVSVTGTVPSLSSAAIAAACQYARFVDAPPFFAGTVGSALAGVAPATITLASVAAAAKVPEVYLW